VSSTKSLVKAGILLAGKAYSRAGSQARALSGNTRTVTDGPFAETKELVAGFWIWQVRSIEEAVEWVKRCRTPCSRIPNIEIRPVFAPEDFGEALTPELKAREAIYRRQTAARTEF